MLSTASFADPLLTESFLQLDLSSPSEPSEEITAESRTTTQPAFQMMENIQGPFAVYIWDENCDRCAQDLQTFDTLQKQGELNGHSVVHLNSGVPNTRSLSTLTNASQLYNPYAYLATKPAPHYQFLPQVRVYNSQGNIAAVYPAFKDNWTPIVRLVKRLNTPEFADYTMPERDIALFMAEQTENGNVLQLKALPEAATPESSAQSTQQTPARPALLTPQYGRTIGPELLSERPDHHPALTQSFAAASVFTNSSDVNANWRGLNLDFATALPKNHRLLVSAHTWRASDFENQLVAPGTANPKSNKIAVGIEGFSGDLLYRTTLFQQPNEFRQDRGISFEIEHLIWNERVNLRLGSTHFKATHDEFVTIESAGSDHNRRHNAGLSFQFNNTTAFTFDWHHNSLQGLIENPDEIVEFGSPGATGTQYALYPTTRTENIYVLQLKHNQRDYGAQYFQDTWSREQLSLFTSSSLNLGQWHVDHTVSLAHQGVATFYADLFPQLNAQNLLSSNAGLAGFDSLVVDVKGTLPLGTTESGFRLWNRPTYLTLGTKVGYFDFETLSEARSARREPISSLAISTSIGLEIEL